MQTKITETPSRKNSVKNSETIPFGFFMGTIGIYRDQLFVKIATRFDYQKHNSTVPMEDGSIIISLSPSGKAFQNIWKQPVPVNDYRSVEGLDITVMTANS